MTISISSRRRKAALLAAFAALSITTACKSHKTEAVQATQEEAAPLASVVNVADPKVSTQLLGGFYGLEQNSWRWTAAKFSVMLRPPRTAPTNGATLVVKLTVPQIVIDKLKAVSLSANIGGTALAPESYTQAGSFTYSRDVPGNVLGGESVSVNFALDKVMAPVPPDVRELGIVVSSVGFEAK